MVLSNGLITFVTSLLVGGLGIYIGGKLITGTDEYGHAVITALIASLVWGIFAFFFGGVPGLGPVIVLLAYVGVIKWRYPGGWFTAAGIALVAWIASLGVMVLLSTVGVGGFDVVGVPGV
jgi:hypothetical protein